MDRYRSLVTAWSVVFSLLLPFPVGAQQPTRAPASYLVDVECVPADAPVPLGFQRVVSRSIDGESPSELCGCGSSTPYVKLAASAVVGGLSYRVIRTQRRSDAIPRRLDEGLRFNQKVAPKSPAVRGAASGRTYGRLARTRAAGASLAVSAGFIGYELYQDWNEENYEKMIEGYDGPEILMREFQPSPGRDQRTDGKEAVGSSSILRLKESGLFSTRLNEFGPSSCLNSEAVVIDVIDDGHH